MSFLLQNQGARAHAVMISHLFSRKTQKFVPFLLENRGARARVFFFPRKLLVDKPYSQTGASWAVCVRGRATTNERHELFAATAADDYPNATDKTGLLR